MKRVLTPYTRVRIIAELALMGIGWSVIIYIWFVRYWQEVTVGEFMWWVETGGHFIGSFFGAMNILHVCAFSSKNMVSMVCRRSKFLNQFFCCTFLVIWVIGVTWELIFEYLLWDSYLQPAYFPWIAKAQHGPLDTTGDIIANTVGSILGGMIYFVLFDFYYRVGIFGKKTEMSQIEVYQRVASVNQELLAISQLLMEEGHQLRHEVFQELRKTVLGPTKKLRDALRTGKRRKREFPHS